MLGHKVILAAASVRLAEYCRQGTTSQGTIVIREDIGFRELTLLVDFIYEGHATFTDRDECEAFQEVLRQFEIGFEVDAPAEIMVSNIFSGLEAMLRDDSNKLITVEEEGMPIEAVQDTIEYGEVNSFEDREVDLSEDIQVGNRYVEDYQMEKGLIVEDARSGEESSDSQMKIDHGDEGEIVPREVTEDVDVEVTQEVGDNDNNVEEIRVDIKKLTTEEINNQGKRSSKRIRLASSVRNRPVGIRISVQLDVREPNIRDICGVPITVSIEEPNIIDII